MTLFLNLYRKTKIKQCPACRSRQNSAADGGNTGCFHCACGWVECVELEDLDW